ncbi:MAG: hypothetical protein KDK70_11360 [Myxococcales bacterium]|nr:hypothetical protein [Myxococcales bacterium]
MHAGTGWRRTMGLFAAWLLGGCAVGGEPELTSQAFDGGDSPLSDGDDHTGAITTGGLGSDDGSESADTSGGRPPDLGSCQDDSDCILPEGTCLEIQGHCEGGTCEHGAAAPGAPCDDAEPCTVSDACDGEGVCFGVPLDCGAGMCIGGECVDPGCPAGFADCNGQMGDGCEIELGTNANCGGCGDSCATGPNATGSCSGGSCSYQCQSPWENCDGDWSNGCEIPVGVPHQCDVTGINLTNGCWTAYCGNSANPNATNFGTFHCIDCATCRSPVAGQCQWCDHTSGVFYPADVCGCGGYEDLVCS